MSESFANLRNGVVLAEICGHGDGPYCAAHGAGAALVVLGTYIVDARDSVPYPAHFVFKPGRKNYAPYLAEHVAAAGKSGARVGVSVIGAELADSVDFLQAAEEAGADYASLCAHSVMEMFTRAGLGKVMCARGNHARLRDWAEALVGAVGIPVIFKTGFTDADEMSAAFRIMADAGVPIVHTDIGDCRPGSAGLAALGRLAPLCKFLIAGGGVRNAADARRILDAGAGAAAIASAAMKDPGLCGRIQAALR